MTEQGPFEQATAKQRLLRRALSYLDVGIDCTVVVT